MSYKEFLQWASFRDKRGSLFSSRRMEQMVASCMALYANANSKNGGYRMFDFAPHEEDTEWTLERAMKEW